MTEAQKLLGALTIWGGGGSAWAGGGCGGLKESNKPPRHSEYTENGAKNGRVPSFFDFKIAKNVVFYLKVLSKIHFQAYSP